MATDAKGRSRPLRGRLRNSCYAWQPSWTNLPESRARNKIRIVSSSGVNAPGNLALLQDAT